MCPGRRTMPTTTQPDGQEIQTWNGSLKKDLRILSELVGKDFKLKYRRSVLGIAWSVLNPLLMMCVMAVVFTQMMRTTDDTIPNFPLYLILGNTAFALMSDSTTRGMSSIIDASSLLKKVKVNKYLFPVQKVLFAAVNYCFSMIAVFIVMAFYRWVPTVHILWFPVYLLLLIAFCSGLSLLLSTLSVFFRDVMHLWGVVLTAWTYMTPLFYSVNILPDWLRGLERFNPMYLFVTFVRRIFLWRIEPGMDVVLGCAACAAISLAIGAFAFNRAKGKFILYV